MSNVERGIVMGLTLGTAIGATIQMVAGFPHCSENSRRAAPADRLAPVVAFFFSLVTIWYVIQTLGY